MYLFLRRIPLLTSILFLVNFCITAQPEKPLDAAQLELAIKKLNVLGSVLYIAAHPDDENTAALAYFESGKLLRAGYCAMNRGSGGQNLIGNEQADELGVIRTQELLAARRIDGAEQFFTRAVDFGYSKNPEETFSIWGKEKILSDVVWIIRKFRPDVIITRFPGTGEGGHGHHTASALLAEEAFKLAADPGSFPEQLKYVKTWQAKRLYWNAWLPILEKKNADTSKLIKIDLGAYNPLLGKSYSEIAAESRSMHKSQGFGVSAKRGEQVNYFQYLEGDTAKNDLFEGIDLTWNRVKGSGKTASLLKEIDNEYNPADPSASIPKLLEAYSELNKLNDDYWVPLKKKELSDVISAAAGIWLEASADDYSFTPGDSVKISVQIVNRSGYPFRLKSISIACGNKLCSNTPDEINRVLTDNILVNSAETILLPANFPYTQPYWLEKPHGKGTYTVNDQQLIGKPDNDPPLTAKFTLTDGKTDVDLSTPVLYQWTDPVHGGEYRPIEITPPVAVNLENKLYLFPDDKSKTVTVKLTGNKKDANGRVFLELPDGWKTEPAEYKYSFSKKGDESTFEFNVTPPDDTAEVKLEVLAVEDGKEINRGMVTIDYPHIPVQTLFPLAEAKLLRLNINKVVNNIGYIMGSGDVIPDYLQQLGYNVKLLTDADLDTMNLREFDAIVTGVRAYNTRDRLAADQPGLMQYVKDGGTLVVQYNTSFDLVVDNIGPYPLHLSHDRITVEEAPITFVDPSMSFVNYPDKIGQKDFEGWVQERGLYFADKWDPEYRPVFSGSDPGETPLEGGMLYANYGKGVYIYTGYSWFRQIPAGVPGAFRIFVNMISAGQNEQSPN
ncbi:MAG TPA: PIG-L family deacetylase [Ignavibacteriaceae bacterium]|nr:PIG-L family deacetylase [Ignavibacteriaceae bacterium]